MKYSACTNFVAVEYDRMFVNKVGHIEPKFKILFRVEIPRSKFTYTEAVDKIIQLNDIWNFDFIPVDRGYGETQIELLHKYGIQNPESGLADKVVGYHFAQKIPVFDPHSRQREEKPLKPFMVNNSVIIFENKKIVLNPEDVKFKTDLEGYRLKGVTSQGAPIFSDENEHTIDCMNLCFLIFEQNYGQLFRDLITTKIYPIEGLNPENIEVVERRFEAKEENPIIRVGDKGVIKIMTDRKKPSRKKFSRRSSF